VHAFFQLARTQNVSKVVGILRRALPMGLIDLRGAAALSALRYFVGPFLGLASSA
jgi:hypothetical protein